MGTASKRGGPSPVRAPGGLFLACALVLCTALALLAALASTARAADGLDRAAVALRQGPVYVDPRAARELTGAEADALAAAVEQADAPVFVAVLPDAAEFDPDTLFQDLRNSVGIPGVYAVALGDRFSARADSSVMPRDEVTALAESVERAEPGVKERVTAFADRAVQQAEGTAPASWDRPAGSGPEGRSDYGAGGVAGLAVLGGVAALFALTLGGSMLVRGLGRRKRRAAWERRQLASLRPVVDEDITAFGEELNRIDLTPHGSTDDDAMRQDYGDALDSYDRAKTAMAAAHRPADVRGVTRALEEGRFALVTLDARRAGKPLPDRRPPCFFDPRHGPASEEALWAPAGGTERAVPVCSADAVRLADGEEPRAREVDTPSGRRPYWEAGPVYGAWAYGYFGAALLPGLLTGTLLGSALSGPGAYAYGAGGEYGGGEYGGGDFPDSGPGSGSDPGDFGGDFGSGADLGGGFGGLGGFGGDFGGGF